MMIIRGEPDVSASLAPFLRRLEETASWCTPRADVSRPATCLRNPDRRPRLLERSYFATVAAVTSGRYHGASTKGTPKFVEQGRLMVYHPDADLCDGAAELETGGYFDVFNTPPWDTWVGFFQDDGVDGDAYTHYLVTWVPPVFEELVARGIEVNPEQCIRWLDETECSLRRRLAEEPASAGGLLSRLFRHG
ncbi:MAG TPA: hypothetical protein VLK84_10875 [Longimicrobium sp.]|nr:hypothetical protein [Longimicrobium sp.]